MDWLLTIVVYGFVSAVLLVKTETRPGGATGRCGDCFYDLAGLPAGARCPECGSTKLETALSTTRSTIDRERGTRWWPSLLLLAMAMYASSLLHEQVLVLAYLREGFTLQQARHVIPIRGADDENGGVLIPLQILLALSPFAALLRRRGLALAVMVGGTIVGLLLAAAFGRVGL